MTKNIMFLILMRRHVICMIYSKNIRIVSDHPSHRISNKLIKKCISIMYQYNVLFFKLNIIFKFLKITRKYFYLLLIAK